LPPICLAAVANFGSNQHQQQQRPSSASSSQQQQQEGGLKRRRWDEDKGPPLPSPTAAAGAGPSSSGGGSLGGSLLRSEGSIGSRGLGLDGRPLSRNGRAVSSTETLEKVRRALTVGFANRIARRMRLHNGYRTCNQKGALAQVGYTVLYVKMLQLEHSVQSTQHCQHNTCYSVMKCCFNLPANANSSSALLQCITNGCMSKRIMSDVLRPSVPPACLALLLLATGAPWQQPAGQ
jgi:hypothetical protein